MDTHRQSRGTRSLGFTLVELLVVIGIIALLIGILLPTLNRAREKSRETACSSNLHQMGLGLAIYVNENGYYPGDIGYHGSTQISIWQTRIRKAIRADDRVFNCPSRDDSVYWVPKYGSGPAFASPTDAGYGYVYDPAHNQFEFLLITANGLAGATPRPFSYGYNDWGIFESGPAPPNISDGNQKGMGGDCDTPGDPTKHELKASRVTYPSEMIVISDRVNGGSSYNYNIDPTNGPEYPGDVHSHGSGGGTNNSSPIKAAGNKIGGSNVLFADGHVTWMSQAELVDVNSTQNPATAADGGHWQYVRRLWNNDHENYLSYTPP